MLHDATVPRGLIKSECNPPRSHPSPKINYWIDRILLDPVYVARRVPATFLLLLKNFFLQFSGQSFIVHYTINVHS